MKRHLLSGVMLVLGLILVSWGSTGHRTVGKIAENHLTPKTKAAVLQLLGGESLAQVSTYADEIKSPETESFHYINVPSGLDFDTFVKTVMNMQKPNAFSALLQFERALVSKTTTKEEKAYALKFIVHLVGDIHQPLHVSHADDLGGNRIFVRFDGNDSNLHSLWDSGLIAHSGLNYQQLAQTYDNATPEQIKQWQNDAAITWAWESYQISEQLYAEAAKGTNFSGSYYTKHFPQVRQRLLQGGIRLAGLLNGLLDPAN